MWVLSHWVPKTETNGISNEDIELPVDRKHWNVQNLVYWNRAALSLCATDSLDPSPTSAMLRKKLSMLGNFTEGALLPEPKSPSSPVLWQEAVLGAAGVVLEQPEIKRHSVPQGQNQRRLWPEKSQLLDEPEDKA